MHNPLHPCRPFQARASGDKLEQEAGLMARRAAQAEAQLAHLQQRRAADAEAECGAAAERERTLAELLAAKSVEGMRQDAHRREVAALQVGCCMLLDPAGSRRPCAFPCVGKQAVAAWAAQSEADGARTPHPSPLPSPPGPHRGSAGGAGARTGRGLPRARPAH